MLSTRGVTLSKTGGNAVTTALIPGVTTTIVVPEDSVVFVTTDGQMVDTGGGSVTIKLELEIDSVVASFPPERRVGTQGATGRGWSFGTTLNLSPGPHTIALRATVVGAGGGSGTVGADSGEPYLQTSMTVLILRR
ncbi:hypothetical protein ACFL59_02390 [Planctomycetota bacterium]